MERKVTKNHKTKTLGKKDLFIRVVGLSGQGGHRQGALVVFAAAYRRQYDSIGRLRVQLALHASVPDVVCC